MGHGSSRQKAAGYRTIPIVRQQTRVLPAFAFMAPEGSVCEYVSDDYPDAMTSSILRLAWADAHLADIPLPGGVMSLTRSLASGLCRSPVDNPGVFWGVGDRGPNIKPRAAADRYGVEQLRPLATLDGAKIMPLPLVGPAIARFRIVDETIVLEDVIELTDSRGHAITGLPVPGTAHSEQEPVYDLSGRPLGTDPGGADTEGIAAMPDGTFWIAEEYGPSLLHIDRSGRVLARWVPKGQGRCFEGAGYPIEEKLPPLASARKLNRGFEAIAAAPDGSSVIVTFQSPLAHPDRQAHDHSRHVRISAYSLRTYNASLI